MLLTQTADLVGVADAIDDQLGDLQKPSLVHTTGHTMTSLALALAIGGDDATEIDLLNPLVATGLIDKIPSDSTIDRHHHELHDSGEDDEHSAELVDGAGTAAVLVGMKTARTAAWSACGTRNPATTATVMNPLVVDIDATEVASHSDKEHGMPRWKKHFGFHPLAAIINHGPGLTGEPTAVLLRPGNAGSNTAADHITVLDQAMTSMPDHVDGHDWENAYSSAPMPPAGPRSSSTTSTSKAWRTRSGSPRIGRSRISLLP